jgi:hypothetical protein
MASFPISPPGIGYPACKAMHDDAGGTPAADKGAAPALSLARARKSASRSAQR